MSILFAAIKAITGLAAATDVSLTVANLATEGAAFFPEIKDAKAYIEYAREEIPGRVDALNIKREILNRDVELIHSSHLAEKEIFENGETILKEVTEDLEGILKAKGLTKDKIAANAIDFETFVHGIHENGALHRTIFGTHMATLTVDAGILAWTMYSDYKFTQSHLQALNKMPPKAKQIFFGSKNPNFFHTLPRASRATLLKSGGLTAISLAGIGINIYTASITRDELVAIATVEKKNLESLEQAEVDQDQRELDQQEMSAALLEYYQVVMAEFLKVTEGSDFHVQLLSKNGIAKASDLAALPFEAVAKVLPDVKAYLDAVIYEILAYKAQRIEKMKSDITRTVELLTIGVNRVDLLKRRLYARVPPEQQLLSEADLQAIVSEYALVIGLCSTQQPVPTEIAGVRFLQPEHFPYIYDFAPECA